jgi:putative serine protease PepD
MDESPPLPRPRRRPPRWLVATVTPAVIGGAVAVGAVAATGNLGGGGTRTVVRDVSAPAAEAPAAPLRSDAALESTGGESVQQIVRRASPGVVLIQATTGDGQALGTGFLVTAKGTVLTNAHVVSGASKVTATFEGHSAEPAKVLGVDEATDVAVLRVDVPSGARPLPLGRTAGLQVGDPVVAIGNPFGLERTATTGIVSGLKRAISSPNDSPIQNAIQTDAAINHGNSGGPLLDARGRVIGINSQIASESGGSDGVGFAVPVDTIRPVMASITGTGKAEHAWLGIVGTEVTPEVAAKLGTPGQTGVAVQQTDPRGPAAEAGLHGASSQSAEVPKGADLIVAVNGVRVRDMADVSEAVASRKVGDRVTLTVIRDNHRIEVPITLANRPANLAIR